MRRAYASRIGAVRPVPFRRAPNPWLRPASAERLMPRQDRRRRHPNEVDPQARPVAPSGPPTRAAPAAGWPDPCHSPDERHPLPVNRRDRPPEALERHAEAHPRSAHDASHRAEGAALQLISISIGSLLEYTLRRPAVPRTRPPAGTRDRRFSSASGWEVCVSSRGVCGWRSGRHEDGAGGTVEVRGSGGGPSR